MVVQSCECTKKSLNYILYIGELHGYVNYIAIKLFKKSYFQFFLKNSPFKRFYTVQTVSWQFILIIT